MSIKYFVPSVLWVILILFSLSLPPDKIPMPDLLVWKFMDKAIHFFLFFVFAILNCYGFIKQNNKSINLNSVFLFAIFLGVLFGIGTEYFQQEFAVGRTKSVNDMLANIFGTLFGVTSWGLYLKINRNFFSVNKKSRK